MSLVFICCVVLSRQRPLRRAGHSSRGVLPGVCMCVITETLMVEEKTLAVRKLLNKKYSASGFQ
jgi:hypothetical protein